MATSHEPVVVGRYLLHRKIARGGMATIHIARLMGDVGFSRIVAAKRMHPELVEDREFVVMFLDEARIASKVHHRNVVPVLDVVTLGDEIMLVQEYIHGAPLSLCLRKTAEAKGHVPVPVAAAIACHTLAGLHAAHETVDELGTPLHIVHRDVSPQNIIVGDDGTVRLLDFGIAKAASTGHITRRGVFKGKLGYTSPEQLRGEATRHSDVYSLGVVLWEMLVGERLHGPQGEAQLVADIMAGQLPTITEALANDRAWIGSYRWNQLEALEPIVRKALDREPRRRWQSAAEMEEALAAAVPIASPNDIAAWLRAVAKDFLELREKLIAEEEASWRRSAGAAAPLPCDHPVASGPATEPELVRALPWRGPTLLLAVLVVVVTATFAFLLRDLKSPKPHRVPAAIVEPMPVAAPVVPPVTTAVSVEHEARVEPPPAVETPPAEPIKPARPKRAAAKPPPARPAPPPPRAAPPPPPTPPPAEKSASVDCTTPFYFEGNKKIFKPGCL